MNSISKFISCIKLFVASVCVLYYSHNKSQITTSRNSDVFYFYNRVPYRPKLPCRVPQRKKFGKHWPCLMSAL